MDSREGTVRQDRDGPLGWVVFDNPARLNALSEDMAGMALRSVEEFAADAAIRVILLRGAGTRAFISGGDISKFSDARGAADEAERGRRNFDGLKSAMRAAGKPVVAMIHGYCLGGGMGLALGADIRLAASTARLGIPAAKRGLGYPWQHMQALVEIVGPAVAKDLMFSGRQVDADEALRMGLVNQVFAADDLEQETRAYALAMAENAPLTIRAAKFAIDEVLRDDADQDRQTMQTLIDAANNSADYIEATRSFLEKRKPVFRGA